MLDVLGFAINLVIISTILTVSVLMALKKKWDYLFILIPLLIITVMVTVDGDTLIGAARYVITPIQTGGIE
ncbi:hypothetical protein COA00_29740 [Bacillus cereus]|uniref:hypothetical protein n=1 Tax=Bacillus cereus TaxID=1396 RepID=UPI000BEE6695|nr:hypothetical protein [Bacillus cereus]PEE32422.1 hypothetical protein CON59_31210 [Bacillus cereus]PFE69075.1 hypothetical protein CN319_23170 [Bacillus cereus]PFV33907.1 hypothetical protein COL00_31475 [Bacillus cereus]PGP57522.1 hypothetical protein COA00_29740 [Bacillus cereus]